MININSIDEIYNLEPMKYWSMSSSTSKEVKKQKLEAIINSNQYIYSQKVDGNLVRAIITPEKVVLQTRGRGVNSGEFGEIQDKVIWSNSLQNAFSDTTILLGEAYVDGGVDKDVGAILRCLTNKALERQKKENKIVKYYIFDVLAYNGEFLFDKPIIDRIQYLSKAAKAIDNPFVSYAHYYEANDSFWDKLNNIFAKGGEGTVLYKKTMLPCEGRTPAWDTVKVKREVEEDIDAFLSGIEPATRLYTGKEIENWEYWEDNKTGKKYHEKKYTEYTNGSTLEPITKPYYYNWPGAIKCSVLNENKEEIELCKCSNLTDELCEELINNFDYYYKRPLRIQGMMISKTYDKNGNLSISVRHPKFINFRDDINIEDCVLSKLL